jgi:RNA polymerase sigma factor (sigma-70 family)
MSADKSMAGDVDTWRSAAAGDQVAFEALYERYCDRLFNYALRRTASWEVSEDVVSIVFLEAWRRRSEFAGEDDRQFAGWLFGIATNVLRNQFRSRRRRRDALERLRAAAPAPDLADHGADQIAGEQQARELAELIGRLPTRDRDALTLVTWAGLDYEAAADALGVPVGTVKSRVARARRRLRLSSLNPNRVVRSLDSQPLPTTEVFP